MHNFYSKEVKILIFVMKCLMLKWKKANGNNYTREIMIRFIK